MQQQESQKPLLNKSNSKNRPTVGIALSGGSSRAITLIGVLEVFDENNIPIDYLVGCSSGALVALSYASKKMEHLKNFMKSMSLQKVISMWSLALEKGGVFEIGEGEQELQILAEGVTFETSRPKLGFTASDVNTGELLTLSMGDVPTAVKASIAVPGLFPPVVWGNRLLVDGGLVNIVPTKPVKEMGADIVIGVNVSGARFIYEKKLPYWRVYRMLTKYLGISLITKAQVALIRKVLDAIVQKDPATVERPGIIRMLTRALDRSMEISDKWTEADMACDYMINPKVKQWKKTELDTDNLGVIYQEGRRAALEAVPKIKELIKQWELKKIEYTS